MRTVPKVVTYITHTERLLIFSHPYAPEAGLQVPAGTIEPGETPAQAALREAWEETNLSGLEMVRYLGQRTWEIRDFDREEIHERHFFHLRCTQTPPEQWEHGEFSASDRTQARHVFAFYWVALDDVPPLIADQGALLDQLIRETRSGTSE